MTRGNVPLGGGKKPVEGYCLGAVGRRREDRDEGQNRDVIILNQMPFRLAGIIIVKRKGLQIVVWFVVLNLLF